MVLWSNFNLWHNSHINHPLQVVRSLVLISDGFLNLLTTRYIFTGFMPWLSYYTCGMSCARIPGRTLIRFFMFLIHSTFISWFLRFYILLLNCHLCFCLRLLICSGALSTNLVRFSFIMLEYLVLFVLLDTISKSIDSPFFRQYLLINSSRCVVRLVCCYFFKNLFLSFQCVFSSLTVLLVGLDSL